MLFCCPVSAHRQRLIAGSPRTISLHPLVVILIHLIISYPLVCQQPVSYNFERLKKVLISPREERIFVLQGSGFIIEWVDLQHDYLKFTYTIPRTCTEWNISVWMSWDRILLQESIGIEFFWIGEICRVSVEIEYLHTHITLLWNFVLPNDNVLT